MDGGVEKEGAGRMRARNLSRIKTFGCNLMNLARGIMWLGFTSRDTTETLVTKWADQLANRGADGQQGKQDFNLD